MENKQKIESIDPLDSDFSIMSRSDKTDLKVRCCIKKLEKINTIARSKPDHVAIDEINIFLDSVNKVLSGDHKNISFDDVDISKSLLTIMNLSLEEEVIRLSDRECRLLEEIESLKNLKV